MRTVDELIAAAKADEEFAFAICRLINHVGSDVKDDWDWNWLQKLRPPYSAAIERSLLESAWKLLKDKDLLNLQTIQDDDRKISTLVPLANLPRLESLGLQNNLVCDLLPLSGISESALESLAVLHDIRIDDEAGCDRKILKKLLKGLSGWSEEFEISKPTRAPALDLRVVTEEEFDYYDGKASYGIRPGECEDGMFHYERNWLLDELGDALKPHFADGECEDLYLPGTGGLRRSERVVLYSLHAYESLRQIATIVQEVLCRARNDWIIYLQALIDEGPDADGIPDDAQNFIVWVYPDKILTTSEHAETVRKLIDF